MVFKSAKAFECYETDFCTIRKFFDLSLLCEDDKKKTILKQIDEIDAINGHVTIAQNQRDTYNQMINSLPADYILIEIDFKQKIKIGKY